MFVFTFSGISFDYLYLVVNHFGSYTNFTKTDKAAIITLNILQYFVPFLIKCSYLHSNKF